LSQYTVVARFAACGLYDFRNSSGSLAILAAIRRALSSVSRNSNARFAEHPAKLFGKGASDQ
jgi:hypothetical protein